VNCGYASPFSDKSASISHHGSIPLISHLSRLHGSNRITL